MSFMVYHNVFLFLTTPFLLYIHQILNTADREQLTSFAIFNCEWVFIIFSIASMDSFLLEPCFLSTKYVQPLVETYKNYFLIIDWFACLVFSWYLFQECKSQDHFIIFSSILGYSIFSSVWLGKNYTIDFNLVYLRNILWNQNVQLLKKK